MIKFTIHKIARLLILLLSVLTLSFLLLHFSPIDPIHSYLKEQQIHSSPEHIKELSKQWGVGLPLIPKITHWMGHLLQGDFGDSLIFKTSVLAVLWQRLKLSFPLLFISWGLTFFFGTMIGIASGLSENRLLDKIIRLIVYIVATLPTFWIATLLILLFAVKIPLFPICCAYPIDLPQSEISFWHWPYHAFLPILALTLVGSANVALYVRAKVIALKESEFFYYAKSLGESPWGTIWHLSLKNILLPVITLQFSTLGELFGGIIFVEQVFTYPGLGKVTVMAATQGDIPLLMGIIFFTTILVFIGNSIADLCYHLLDHRKSLR